MEMLPKRRGRCLDAKRLTCLRVPGPEALRQKTHKKMPAVRVLSEAPAGIANISIRLSPTISIKTCQGQAHLFCQWIRPHLEMHHLACRAFPRLHVEGRTRTDRRPDAAAFPARVRIIDAAVHPLRVKAHRIRDT